MESNDLYGEKKIRDTGTIKTHSPKSVIHNWTLLHKEYAMA